MAPALHSCSDQGMRVPGIILKTHLPDAEPDPVRRRALLRSGRIRSVGQWYVTEEAPQDLIDVLALHLRPTCLDAAALHGLWVPISEGTHVFRPRTVTLPSGAPPVLPIRRQVDPSSGALVPPPPPAEGGADREPQPLVLHAPRLRNWPSADPVPDLGLTLAHAARCLPTLDAAILIESALHRGALTRTGLATLLDGLPARTSQSLSRVRSDAQSGTETAVRWWFERRRVTVRSQAQLLPDVRVDLLVGTNWVIECDSRSFHDDPNRYREDRRRDLALAERGYRVTRLTWEQVFLQWEGTEQMLLTMLRRREHRRALPG